MDPRSRPRRLVATGTLILALGLAVHACGSAKDPPIAITKPPGGLGGAGGANGSSSGGGTGSGTNGGSTSSGLTGGDGGTGGTLGTSCDPSVVNSCAQGLICAYVASATAYQCTVGGGFGPDF